MLNKATRAVVADTLDFGIDDPLLADDVVRSDEETKHDRTTSREAW